MSTETRDRQAETAPTTPAKPSTVPPLEKVADAVRRDSRREPERYLDETVTQHGGE